MIAYRGRFAPSPTGPLHAGSLVAALASYLDAKAHGGQWLIRIEDVDTPRCIAGMDKTILHQLATLGLHSDEMPVYQSERSDLYQAALDRLIAEKKVSKETYIWMPSLPNWKMAEQIPEVLKLVALTPPPFQQNK